MLGAFVEIVLQIFQAINHACCQRRIDFDAHFTRSGVDVRRQHDRLRALTGLLDLPSRAHDVRRGVTDHLQRSVRAGGKTRLAGIDEIAGLRDEDELRVLDILRFDRPCRHAFGLRRNLDVLLRIGEQAHTRRRERERHAQWIVGVVAHICGELRFVADSEEARRHRANEQRLGRDDVHRVFADFRIGGHAHRVERPRREIIRQFDRHTAFARRIGGNNRIPVGGIRKLFAHFDVGRRCGAGGGASSRAVLCRHCWHFGGRRRCRGSGCRNRLPCECASLRGLFLLLFEVLLQALIQFIDRHRQVRRGIHAQRAFGIERVEDRIDRARQQGQHSLVHQIERELHGDRLAVAVGGLNRVRHTLAGLGLSPIGCEGNLQSLRRRLHFDRQQAHFVIAQLVCRVLALDQHDRHVHIRRQIGRDGQFENLSAAGDLDQLILQNAAALDRDQRPVLALERRRDENARGLAGHVRRLIADQRDAIVVLALPRDVFQARDPLPDRGAHFAPGAIRRFGDDLVRTGLRRRIGDAGFALVVGRRRGVIHRDVFRHGLPSTAARRVFDELVLVFAADDVDADRLVRQPVALPIDGDQIDRRGLLLFGDIVTRLHAHVEIAAVPHNRLAARDDLVVFAGHGRLDDQPHRLGDGGSVGEFEIAGNLDREVAVGIGRAGTGQDRLRRRKITTEPPAVEAHPGIIGITPMVVTAPRWLEVKRLLQHIPLQRLIRHAAAEEVIHRHLGGRRLPAHDLFVLRGDHHFKLRRAIGRHGERRIRAGVGKCDLHVVLAQCRASA